jgi:hypothetical protein
MRVVGDWGNIVVPHVSVVDGRVPNPNHGGLHREDVHNHLLVSLHVWGLGLCKQNQATGIHVDRRAKKLSEGHLDYVRLSDFACIPIVGIAPNLLGLVVDADKDKVSITGGNSKAALALWEVEFCTECLVHLLSSEIEELAALSLLQLIVGSVEVAADSEWEIVVATVVQDALIDLVFWYRKYIDVVLAHEGQVEGRGNGGSLGANGFQSDD